MKALTEIGRKYYKYEMVPDSVIGYLTLNNSIASGFSANNYVQVPNGKPPVSGNGLLFDRVEYKFTFTTGDDITTVQTIAHCENLVYLHILNGSIISYNKSTKTNIEVLSDISPNHYYSVNIAINILDNNRWVSITHKDSPTGTWYGGPASNDTSINFATTYPINVGIDSIGNVSPAWRPFKGSIDFNNSSITYHYQGADYTLWSGTTQGQALPSTSSDYDFYRDENIYKVKNENSTLKTLKSWEKGQYYGN